MIKVLTMGASGLLGLALFGFQPAEPEGPPGAPPPPVPPKKKGEGGPAGELRVAYELLRRLKSEGRSAGRPEERLRDWTDRASKLYRDGVKAFEGKELRRAREYGLAAHDLARAVEHSRNASVYEERDSDLPPPPGAGSEGNAGRVRGDLWRAHDRIRNGLDAKDGGDSKFYLEAARDLYNASRRDAEAGRTERAGELARAAEAITHVSEHLAAATREGDPPRPDGKGDARKGLIRKKGAPPAPYRTGGGLPPLPPGTDGGPDRGDGPGAPPPPPPPPPPLTGGPDGNDRVGETRRRPRPPAGGLERKTDQRRDELPPPL